MAKFFLEKFLFNKKNYSLVFITKVKCINITVKICKPIGSSSNFSKPVAHLATRPISLNEFLFKSSLTSFKLFDRLTLVEFNLSEFFEALNSRFEFLVKFDGVSSSVTMSDYLK